ncbi:MAG: hypothetical protein ACWA44_12775 [Thiotrichales bacterium]
MQHTKSTIDLVNRLRRSAPKAYAHKVKLANEQLLEDLIGMKDDADDLFLDLLAQLCEYAGSPWPERLKGEVARPDSSDSRRAMFYRGQRREDGEAPATEQNNLAGKRKTKIKRVYRGQVIYEDE